MLKKTKMVFSVILAVAVLFCTAILMLPKETNAGTKVVAIEGVSYNVNSSMADNLKSLMGKKVYVTLDSGKSFAGNVKEVGDHLMHLEKLDGKDYFDALLRIENINAIDTRFRNIQR